LIKSASEIELMQKACDITGAAFDSVLKLTKPGLMEYEVEADIVYNFLKRGSRGHAYEPIIAGGANSCVLHYVKNEKELQDGDLLLLDFGAEYANYAADMTRTIPVNGKYSSRQRQVYNALLRVFRQSMTMLTPGALLEEVTKETGRLIEGELIDLGLLSKADVEKQSPEKPLYKKYFMHGLGHYLGLDVHDIGNRYKPLQNGMVLTCEPGIYIREEGIGIRLENDVVINGDKPIDMMANIPIEADHIEEIMNA
jgi:Xaa-Pro aminopeptidase